MQIVRRATAEEVALACEIDEIAFSPYNTSEPPEVIAARFDVYPEGFVVAEVDGLIVGYASAECWVVMRTPQIGEMPRDTHTQDGKVFCLTAMAVRPGYQRQGLGTMLLKNELEIARQAGCTEVVLETSQAMRFYEKAGFRLLEERYHGRTQLAVMHMNL